MIELVHLLFESCRELVLWHFSRPVFLLTVLARAIIPILLGRISR